MTSLYCAYCGLLQRVSLAVLIKPCRGCSGKMFVTLPSKLPIAKATLRESITPADRRFLKSLRIAWNETTNAKAR